MISSLSRSTLFILIGLLTLAFCLRLYRVGTYSIYFDEKSTLLISQGVVLEGSNQRDVFSKPYFTPTEFWKPKTFNDFIEANIRGDIGNSPAYYAVVWFWLKLFGLSDTSLRMPSVIFSTLTVWLLFIFVRRHFQPGSRTGGSNSVGFASLNSSSVDTLALLSAAVAAIEPFFVTFSHVARNYSMSFFLTLLATHVFLLIIERVRTPYLLRSETSSAGPPLTMLYVAYGAIFVLALLSHYLTITVFLCHGLYALLFLRTERAWLALGAIAAVGIGLVSLWFIFGGGKYTFYILEDQKNFYRNLALTNPTGNGYGVILPATFLNITRRAVPIFSDLLIVTNGLGSQLLGIRNAVPAVSLGLLATLLMHRYYSVARPPIWVYGAFAALILIGLPFYTVTPIRLLVLSVSLPFIYLIARFIIDNTNANQKRVTVLLLLLTFIPTLFLLFMAWRSGHTYGITQRYSGFSFPYVCILVAMGLYQLPTLKSWFSLPIIAVLCIQAFHIIQLLGSIYTDGPDTYPSFAQPRIANPFWSSAQRIKELYTPGDTVLYPNKKRAILSEKNDKSYAPVSLIDAQTVNIYLPNDAQYIQRIDPNEQNRIVLVKGNTGEKIVIFDFKGGQYRYGD